MSPRYAIFFSPEDGSELAEFGRRVLGREADGSPALASPTDYPDRQQAATFSKVPSHYGFHATLKAPFTLATSHSVDELLQSVEGLASSQHPIAMAGLELCQMSDFMALAFAQQVETIKALAQQCVQVLEPLRAPLTPEDLLRRAPEKLTPRQQEYLHLYGYPYVMDEFRFHMTLTGHLSAEDKIAGEPAAYIDWLNECYARLVSNTPVLDRLCVFWQPDKTQPFRRLEQFAFQGNVIP